MTSRYPIQLPIAFQDKLSGTVCSRLVLEALEEFAAFIAVNEMIFFRQYTDHGPRHVQAVLETASALITQDSWDLVSPEDIAVLVIATLLHDIALHLQEPGFLALIDISQAVCVPELDTDPWHVLWTQYITEVSRFSQNQLSNIFGQTEPIESPDLDKPDTWTPLQHTYIGEFLRRHHHRLAHEVACMGLPGSESSFPKRGEVDSLSTLMTLSGLVARSHGMAIRPLLPFLSTHFHLRKSSGCHPVYLMVLLRVADYLQLQSDRAPGRIAKFKRIQRPDSRKEWKVHESIKDILYNQNQDPESVEIQVHERRTSIEVFLRLQEWLNGIQTELDTSWAVLGEIYGRFPEHRLGLTIRRIRSNIEDREIFGRAAGFVPHRVTFSAADSQLLKLLIKPLYGDRPEIAVRELVQNAVDAVLERRALTHGQVDGTNSDVEVHIKKLDNGRWSLVVEDNGVGMTYDTLAHFFLNAGASFRSSMTWKKHFQDEDGQSTVLRSGRFGVGALAAFLLADDPQSVTLKVSTRHFHARAEDGFEFEAELTDRPLNIRHITKDTPGTRIEVVTSSAPAFMQRANKDDPNLVNEWDWFCLDSPKVRRVGSSGDELKQQVTLPFDLATSPLHYHWIHPEGYLRVGWTYKNVPAFVCNGIIVARDAGTIPPLARSRSSFGEVTVRTPYLSVFDRNGRLPLTLDRLRVDFERISFLNELRNDVFKNIAAYLAVCAPPAVRTAGAVVPTEIEELRSHPAISEDIRRIPWVFAPHGVSIFDPHMFSQLGVSTLLEVSDLSHLDLVVFLDRTAKFAFTMSEQRNSIRENTGAIKRIKTGVVKRVSYLEESDRYLKEVLRMLPRVGENDARSTALSVELFLQRFRSSVDVLITALGTSDAVSLVPDVNRICDEVVANATTSMQVTKTMVATCEMIEKATTASQPSVFLARIQRMGDNDSATPYYSRMTKSDARYAIRHLPRLVTGKFGLFGTSPLLRKVISRIDELLNTDGTDVVPSIVESAIQNLRRLAVNRKTVFQIDGDLVSPIIDWQQLASADRLIDGFRLKEHELNESLPCSSSTILGRIWLEFFGTVVIPYDPVARKESLKHFFQRADMQRHLQHWESVIANAISKVNKH